MPYNYHPKIISNQNSLQKINVSSLTQNQRDRIQGLKTQNNFNYSSANKKYRNDQTQTQFKNCKLIMDGQYLENGSIASCSKGIASGKNNWDNDKNM